MVLIHKKNIEEIVKSEPHHVSLSNKHLNLKDREKELDYYLDNNYKAKPASELGKLYFI